MPTLAVRDGNGGIQLLNVTDIGGGVLDTHHIIDDVANISALKVVISQVQAITASSAYAAGNVVGGLLTFANAVRVGKTGGTINSVIITDKSGSQVQFDLWLFDSNPTATTVTDKTLLTVNAVDLVRSIGFVSINAWCPANAGGAIGQGLLDLRFALATGTTLYGILMTRGTPTFASVSDVQVRLVISQD